MSKKTYPIKDGWLHATLRYSGIHLSKDEVLNFLRCGKDIEVADYKELKTCHKVIYRFNQNPESTPL
jgi:hypothetical protein